MLKHLSIHSLLLCCFAVLGCTASLGSFDEPVSDTGSETTNTPGNTPGNTPAEPDDVVELSADLTCDSLSFCTNYKINFENVEMPSRLGGVIEDGVYRVIEGTNVFYGLIIQESRFSYLWPDLTVTHGDIETQGDEILLSSHTFCGRNDSSDPFPGLEETTRHTYAVDGRDLFLRGPCGPPNGCPGATVFRKVDSLCENLSGYDCPDGGCACSQFVEEPVPESLSLDTGCSF